MPCEASRPPAPPAELLTFGQVAQLLCVSVSLVRLLAAKGELRPVHVRGCTRWRRRDVARYVDQLAAKPHAAEAGCE